MQSANRVSTCSSSRDSPKNANDIHELIGDQLIGWGGGLLTKGQQGVLQFSEQHGAVLLLVVQFQALNEILIAALLLLLLHLRVDGQEFVQLDLLLVALLGATHFLDQSQGGVQVQSAQGIA